MTSLEAALAESLLRFDCVRAAWLFGSVADGTEGPLSDVDVAVLGCGGLDLDGLGRLSTELGRAAGCRCDVVVVERASPVLAMEIVRRARRIVCRDDAAADEWEDYALRRYLGTAHLRKMVQEALHDDLSRSQR